MDILLDIVGFFIETIDFFATAHANRTEYKKLPKEQREEIDKDSKDTLISFLNDQNPNGF